MCINNIAIKCYFSSLNTNVTFSLALFMCELLILVAPPSPHTLTQVLVAPAGTAASRRPVDYYEAETHYHEGDTQGGKAGGLE